MKKYKINVHYDYFVPVEVEAESRLEAIELAKEKASDVPSSEMEFGGCTDACIAGVSTDEDDLEELAKLHNQLHN